MSSFPVTNFSIGKGAPISIYDISKDGILFETFYEYLITLKVMIRERKWFNIKKRSEWLEMFARR